jgi:ribose transport system permease protein
VKRGFLARIGAERSSYNRPTLGIALFVVLLVVYATHAKNFFSMFQFKDIILNSTLAIALAAVGAGIVLISGGFDLSAGATVVLLNVTLVTAYTNKLPGGIILWSVICMAIGIVVGLTNGFLVAVIRLPPIIATLAMSFILQGIALLVMPTPTGMVPPEYIEFWTGTAWGVIPTSLIIFLLLFVFLFVLKNSSFGTNVYAIGSDEYAAFLNGISVTRVKLAVYTLAGFFYGLCGLYFSAQMGSGDATLASPLLLSVLAAVVVGGISIGGGKGALSGSIVGAAVMNMTVMVLFVVGVSSYWGPIANGIVLVGAVVLTAFWNR